MARQFSLGGMLRWRLTPVGGMRNTFQVYRYFQTGGTDDRGQPIRERRRVFNVRGMIGPLRGTQAEIARKLVTQATTQINMQWTPGIDLQDEIQFKDRSGKVRVYAINLIENIGELNREHEVLCTETQL